MLIIGCVGCHKPLDGHQGLSGAGTPSPGDVLICAYCSAFNLLDDDMRPREPTDQERIDIDKQVREILREMRRKE